NWRVHGVSIRPGRPTAYGIGPDGQQVFGLPGNPVGCLVCLRVFVSVAIDGQSGLPPVLPSLIAAQIRTDVRASKDPRPAFLPAAAWPLRYVCLVRWMVWVCTGVSSRGVYFASWLLGIMFFAVNVHWLWSVTQPGDVALCVWFGLAFPLTAWPVRHMFRR